MTAAMNSFDGFVIRVVLSSLGEIRFCFSVKNTAFQPLRQLVQTLYRIKDRFVDTISPGQIRSFRVAVQGTPVCEQTF